MGLGAQHRSAAEAKPPALSSARSEKVATECLKNAGWGVEAAIDHFYSSGLAAQATTASGGLDLRAVEGLYQRYKGKTLRSSESEGWEMHATGGEETAARQLARVRAGSVLVSNWVPQP